MAVGLKIPDQKAKRYDNRPFIVLGLVMLSGPRNPTEISRESKLSSEHRVPEILEHANVSLSFIPSLTFSLK